MVAAILHKAAFSGAAAAVAAGVSLVTSAAVDPEPAYGAAAVSVEAEAVVREAISRFERADLNKDGALDEEEFAIMAIVGAELARLNGFVPIAMNGEVRTIPLGEARREPLTKAEKAMTAARAAREYRVIAGDDERVHVGEFVDAELEKFIADDADRNGELSGVELASFAHRQARLAPLQG